MRRAGAAEVSGADRRSHHRWVKPLARTELLIASLDKMGTVVEFERMGAAEAAALWRIERSNCEFSVGELGLPGMEDWRRFAAVKEWRACPVEDTAKRAALLEKVCSASELFRRDSGAFGRMQKFCRELRPRFRQRRRVRRILRAVGSDRGSQISRAKLGETMSGGRDRCAAAGIC